MRSRVRPADAPTTDDVVARARAGDETAWATIVADLGPAIAGYARARGAPDPEDVMQDVFLAAASRLSRFEGDGRAFRSWVFSIAYRQIVDRYRSRRDNVELPVSLADPGPSPEQTAITGIVVSEAMAALDVLTDVERDVVLLRVIGGLETDEVARAVGKRGGNVRVIQTRALAKLRGELQRSGYGAEGLGEEEAR